MALITSYVFSAVVPTLVDVPIVGIASATGSAITDVSVDAKDATRVEGTAVETVGMTVRGAVTSSLCLDCIAFSNSLSVSFSYSFNLRTRSISSSSFCFSITFVVWGWWRGRILSCYFNAAISSFFFLINYSAALKSLGSCASSITKYSKVFIMMSLA